MKTVIDLNNQKQGETGLRECRFEEIRMCWWKCHWWSAWLKDSSIREAILFWSTCKENNTFNKGSLICKRYVVTKTPTEQQVWATVTVKTWNWKDRCALSHREAECAALTCAGECWEHMSAWETSLEMGELICRRVKTTTEIARSPTAHPHRYCIHPAAHRVPTSLIKPSSTNSPASSWTCSSETNTTVSAVTVIQRHLNTSTRGGRVQLLPQIYE